MQNDILWIEVLKTPLSDGRETGRNLIQMFRIGHGFDGTNMHVLFSSQANITRNVEIKDFIKHSIIT